MILTYIDWIFTADYMFFTYLYIYTCIPHKIASPEVITQEYIYARYDNYIVIYIPNYHY